MFSILGGNKKQKLEKKYAKLLAESQKLSLVDRQKADLKYSEAEDVLKEIEKLEQTK